MGSTAEQIMARLTEVYPGARDATRAGPMAAYMRDRYPFLGLPATDRAVLDRAVLAGLPRPTEAELHAVADACWALPEREYQYFACALLRRHARACTPASLPVARRLIITKPWWDTVDTLASHLVGPLVAGFPALVATMDAWAGEEDLWLVRTALLHQLRYGAATDAQRLFRYCTAQAGHPDFFVRKAIGWALREYAKTDAAAVRAYVHAAGDRLSPLSAREALRAAGRH
ncbi:MAG TPA: DNA alkylation repair protein [Pilimelia sp.]|nr:DNA alkylation repair protein [Pilimelia sp.]